VSDGPVVVKLGSSVVADDRGAVRHDLLGTICDQVTELHAGGRGVVVVSSGAIACGMRELDLEVRPRAVDELQAASAGCTRSSTRSCVRAGSRRPRSCSRSSI
jgi:glutamate 5-kinase